VRFKNEILSGLTVAIAQIPESVAFSFVAGVDPLVGLYATFFMGLITALIGGRPGMVSGMAAASLLLAQGLPAVAMRRSATQLRDAELAGTA